MTDIQVLSTAAYQHLMDRDPKTWSRAFFLLGRGCDAVENGISESFNNLIVDARKKPIITMLEEIRMYVMNMVYNLNIKASNWDNYMVCPNTRTILNELGKLQRYWQVFPCGYNQFEARNMSEAYTVNLEKNTCSCRLWQLNGYGCVHLIATIAYLNRIMDAYVDPLFLATFYKNSYKYPLLGMNGSNMWPATDFIPPLPPLKRKKPGRPTIKRKRDVNERLGRHKVSKIGKRVSCGVCKQPVHNKTTCPNNQPPSGTSEGRKTKRAKSKGNGSSVKERGQASNQGQDAVGAAQQVGDVQGHFKESQPLSQIGNATTKGKGKQVRGGKAPKRSKRIVKKKLAKKVMGKW